MSKDDNPGTWHVAAADLFGDGVYYKEDSWTDWNDNQATERKFFNAEGAELGNSFTNVDTWEDWDGTSVTHTSTNYHGPDDSWLGYEWANNSGEKGSNFESTVSSSDSSAWTALVDEFTWLQNDAGDAFAFSNTTLIVQSGSSTYTVGEGDDATTVTETRKHLFSVTDEGWMDQHLGGKEDYSGEVVQWNANWERGKVKFSIDADSMPTAASDSQAYALFSPGGDNPEVYTRTETWTHDYGSDSETSYYDSNGEMLGSSFTNSGSWTCLLYTSPSPRD